MNKFVLTTMCYIQKDNQTLMIHRIKKADDINHGKWIGIGGKFEKGEFPLECIQREIQEETALKVKDFQLHGVVFFPSLYHGEDECMFVYSCQYVDGEIPDCIEGDLAWIDNDKIKDLPMWKGDYHFLEWMKDDLFHSAKVVYDHDEVIEYKEETV